MRELLECVPLVSRHPLKSIRQAGPGLRSARRAANGLQEGEKKLLLYLLSLPSQFMGVITQITSEKFITFSLKTSPRAPCCAALQLFNKTPGCREEKKMQNYKLTSGLPPDN